MFWFVSVWTRYNTVVCTRVLMTCLWLTYLGSFCFCRRVLQSCFLQSNGGRGVVGFLDGGSGGCVLLHTLSQFQFHNKRLLVSGTWWAKNQIEAYDVYLSDKRWFGTNALSLWLEGLFTGKFLWGLLTSFLDKKYPQKLGPWFREITPQSTVQKTSVLNDFTFS